MSILQSIASFFVGGATTISAFFFPHPVPTPIVISNPPDFPSIEVVSPNGKYSNRLDIKHFAQTLSAVEKEMDSLGGESPVSDLVSAINTLSQHGNNLGASLAIPTIIALFETSLASNIDSTATSFTLTSAADKAGTSLASSTYAFIIDENSSSEEMVLADCTGTACTNVTRGISVVTGTTTVTSLEHSHRRGASVKITDGPELNILTRILNGIATLPNIISYTSHPTFIATTNLVDKKYVDDAAFSGAAVIDATAAARGVVELATTGETASSTAQGSSGVLVIPATVATSTWNPATAALRVPVAQNNGKIDNNWISTSTLIANNGIGYTLPPTRGASSTVLSENGSGILSWNKTNLGLLTSTTTTVGMLFATTTFTAASHLEVVFYGVCSGNELRMNFNADAGANYGYQMINYSPAATTFNQGGQTSLSLMANDATTSPAFAVVDVENASSTVRKYVQIQTTAGVGSNIPHASVGSGVWNNTSAAITSIAFSCQGSTLNSGAIISIYGSTY